VPATFPAHPAAVLPVKLRWPRRFDGVALVIGAMAPDLSYPAIGFVDPPDTHAPAALVWWCLPVTVLLGAAVRWAAPTAAVHLPRRVFELPDYGAIGGVRHRWYVVGWSALFGAGTHLVWDSFTHGRAARHLPALRHLIAGVPVWEWSQQLSTVVGGLATVVMLAWIGRRRLVRTWHGPAPRVPRAPLRFWTPVALLGCGYLVSAPLLPALRAPHVQVTRLLCLLGLGVLVGAALARSRPGPPPPAEVPGGREPDADVPQPLT
jgi:hypothetical protein